ncbi:hypothetical protein C8J56DRAFT_896997 [Mycena floridula]|nr:hypothetical protein C8J56DRAFT_896997 [Mycena floridula]
MSLFQSTRTFGFPKFATIQSSPSWKGSEKKALVWTFEDIMIGGMIKPIVFLRPRRFRTLLTTIMLVLPEELLNEIIPFLVGEDDYEYQRYPESIYHYASSNILSLSLVNRLLRRICYPFLFTYFKCKGLQELETLESECLAHSPFTSFIRILDVDVDSVHDYDMTTIQFIQGLVRLLGCPLPSLIWLNLHETLMTAALLAAINAHHSLETASIGGRPENVTLALSSSPFTVEKLQFHYLSFYQIRTFAVVQHRNVRATRFHIDKRLVQEDDSGIQLETMLIRDLQVLFIAETGHASMKTEGVVDRLHGFIARHPELTKISLSIGSLGKECTFARPYISSFLDVVEDRCLGGTLELVSVGLSPVQLTGYNRWRVTELFLIVRSDSSFEAIALAGIIFPELSSLTLDLHNKVNLIHIDDFVDLISKHLPNLRVLQLNNLHSALIWTPQLIPTCIEFSADLGIDNVVACTRWLAWRIFEASTSTVKVSVHETGKVPVPASSLLGARTWSLSAGYRPRRDLFGHIFKMEIDSRVIARTGIMERRRQHTLTFRGSVAV